MKMNSSLNRDPIVEAWILDINESHGQNVASILATCALFLRARAELDDGLWGKLFGSGRLRYSMRTAQMFMVIGRCRTLVDPKYISQLPAAWSVLYRLTTLPERALLQAIAEGAVHAEMSVKEADKLIRANKIKALDHPEQQKIRAFNSEQRVRKVYHYLGRELERWPPKDRPELAGVLHGIADDILTGAYALAPNSSRT